jgi:hypothetical protein
VTDPPQVFPGSCLCGAVQFRVHAPTLWCAHCHCTMCQRAHGAAFVTWVGAAAERITIEDNSRLAWYRSSEKAERGFCRSCGSTLFFRGEHWPGEVHVARANFHGDIDRQPEGHAFFATHVSWFPITDDLPKTSP